MEQQCQSCCRKKKEIAQKAAKVQVLEQELATCQQYVRNQTAQMEKSARRHQLVNNEMQKKYQSLENEHQNLTTKYNETRQCLQDAIADCEKLAKTVRNYERNEASFVKTIEDLEASNKENGAWQRVGKPAPQRKMDSDISKIIKRTETLKATGSSVPEKSKSVSQATLEERKLMLTETKFAMEAYDPVAQATELFLIMMQKTDDPVLKVEAQIVMEEFKDDFNRYMEALDNSIHQLSATKLDCSALNEIPRFPDPFDLNFMARLETSLKHKKVVSEQHECPICNTPIAVGPGAVACVGCKTLYHSECGSAFADENLMCYSPKCSKNFKDTKWS